MEDTYWLPQTNDKPLFDDILWSKPEQRSQSGKLAIIGGNINGFNSTSAIYAAAEQAGAGVIRALLPNSLTKTVSKLWPECEYSLSTKIGSFSSKSLNDWLSISEWSDGVIIGGDLTHNSETAILLERFIEKSTSTLTLVCDAIDIITDIPSTIFDRVNLTVAMDLKQLQKLLMAIRFPMPVKSTMTLRQLVGLLHSLTLNYGFSIVTTHENQAYIALNGIVSTTPIKTASIEPIAAYITVWRIHHPNKPLEAMTTGLYDLGKQII